MATRFIDKDQGAESTVATPAAITNTTANKRKLRNLPDNAAFVYDKVDHTFKFNGNDAIRSLVVADAAVNISSEIVTTTNVITAAENGKTFFLNNATEFVSTLPAPALGLFFRFVVTDAPETADYTIVTNGAAEVIIGQVFGSDGGDGDSEVTAGGTTITFVAAASVLGDTVEVISDGTYWYARCWTNVATTGITITG